MMHGSTPEPRAPVVHIVEGDESMRKATARLLQAAGHAVRTYGTGAEFLSAAPAHTSGCVVLDLQLPGSSGLDVQQALNQADDALPVVFLSGHGEVSDSVRAMKSGAVDFLTKSMDGNVLLEAVSRALARSAEERITRGRLRELRARDMIASARASATCSRI
jgi:FixJ family two-component response regulator